MLSGKNVRQERPRSGKRLVACTLGSFVLVIALGAAFRAIAQDAKPVYAAMAPLEQYLIPDQNAEVALARTAAPASVSGDAGAMILGRTGYQTATKGTSGFVCIVERSWMADKDDPDFWNPKRRLPICFNAAAARSFLPRTIRKTELILAGRSEDEAMRLLEDEISKGVLPAVEAGSMCYMMSRQGNFGEGIGPWHPHVMFFVQQTEPAAWGANEKGSPMLAAVQPWGRSTTFMVPVRTWSDGTPDTAH